MIAPMFAELENPIPELSIIFTCTMAALGTRFLKIPGKYQELQTTHENEEFKEKD